MPITLNELSELAHELVKADSAVEEAEKALSRAKETARLIREETIPGVMQELELTKVVLDSGEEVTIKQDVYLAILANNRPIAYRWLSDNGFGGLLKNELKASFGRGEEEIAASWVESMRENGIDVACDTTVHAQTLKSWAKEMLEEGKPFPMELFGARPVWTTKIKEPKQSKKKGQ